MILLDRDRHRAWHPRHYGTGLFGEGTQRQRLECGRNLPSRLRLLEPPPFLTTEVQRIRYRTDSSRQQPDGAQARAAEYCISKKYGTPRPAHIRTPRHRFRQVHVFAADWPPARRHRRPQGQRGPEKQRQLSSQYPQVKTAPAACRGGSEVVFQHWSVKGAGV